MAYSGVDPFQHVRFILISPITENVNSVDSQLRQMGARLVFNFDSADSALPMIQICVELGARAPVIVICQPKLPGKSGLELLELMRLNPDYVAIPYVLWTSAEDKASIRYSVDHDAAARISPQPTPDALDLALKDCFLRIDWDAASRAIEEHNNPEPLESETTPAAAEAAPTVPRAN